VVAVVADEGAVAVAAPVAAPAPASLEELTPADLDKKAKKKWLKEKQKEMDKQVKKLKKGGMDEAAAKAKFLGELATSMTPLASTMAAPPGVEAAPAAAVAEAPVEPEAEASDDEFEW